MKQAGMNNSAMAQMNQMIDDSAKLVKMATDHDMRLSYSSESSVQKELERESNADAMTVLLSFAAMFVYMTVVLGKSVLWMNMKVQNLQ